MIKALWIKIKSIWDKTGLLKRQKQPVKFCDGCIYISVTEEEQNKIYAEYKRTPSHMCSGDKLRVLKHSYEGRSYHPNIVRPDDCPTNQKRYQ